MKALQVELIQERFGTRTDIILVDINKKEMIKRKKYFKKHHGIEVRYFRVNEINC